MYTQREIMIATRTKFSLTKYSPSIMYMHSNTIKYYGILKHSWEITGQISLWGSMVESSLAIVRDQSEQRNLHIWTQLQLAEALEEWGWFGFHAAADRSWTLTMLGILHSQKAQKVHYFGPPVGNEQIYVCGDWPSYSQEHTDNNKLVFECASIGGQQNELNTEHWGPEQPPIMLHLESKEAGWSSLPT